MKMLIIGNYWLAILAWCLFLNDYVFLSEVVLILGCLMLLLGKKGHNYLGIIVCAIITYIILYTILSLTRIPYFFPNLSIYLVIVSIHCFMMSDYFSRLNDHFILPVIVIILLNIIFTATLIIIIPDQFYSLIGKINLLILTCFIFLPYLSPLIMCFVSRKHKRKISYMQYKELQL